MKTLKTFSFIILAIGFFYAGKLSEQKKQSNEIKFAWEGLEKDIPKDGNQMLNLKTNENTIYLNPVDE